MLSQFLGKEGNWHGACSSERMVGGEVVNNSMALRLTRCNSSEFQPRVAIHGFYWNTRLAGGQQAKIHSFLSSDRLHVQQGIYTHEDMFHSRDGAELEKNPLWITTSETPIMATGSCKSKEVTFPSSENMLVPNQKPNVYDGISSTRRNHVSCLSLLQFSAAPKGHPKYDLKMTSCQRVSS